MYEHKNKTTSYPSGCEESNQNPGQLHFQELHQDPHEHIMPSGPKLLASPAGIVARDEGANQLTFNCHDRHINESLSTSTG